MRTRVTVLWLLTALLLCGVGASEAARSEEAVAIRSGAAITPLPVRGPLETAEVRFTGVAARLIGKPDTETLGVSISTTVVPKVDLTGKEKAVLYFYATCDDEPPGRTGGVLVATHELGDLAAGSKARPIAVSAAVSALVPLSSVSCAKLGVVCQECAAHAIRRLDPVLDPAIRVAIDLDAPSLALVGEPASKSFGVAFRGTVRPKVDLLGEEKVVIRLYVGCADTDPPGPEATNVANVELASLRQGSDPHRLVATKDATSFVPMREVTCAVVDME